MMPKKVNKLKRKQSSKISKLEVPNKFKKIKLNCNEDVDMSNETVLPEDKSDIVEYGITEDEIPTKMSNNSNIVYNNKHSKEFSRDFKMLVFRTSLKGRNFITGLRHFLYLADLNNKIVNKYLTKRGNPLELAETIERIDKTNAEHAGYICKALHLVIMEILTNKKDLIESAINACRYFLRVHAAIIELLLNSTELEHRRISLKLLTSIICVDPQLARQILNMYSFSNLKSLEQLFAHNKLEINNEESVRKCFIHFVLSFLVDGNILLINNMLDRGTLMPAIVSGLVYDDHATVCVVLNTLHERVLHCQEISRTNKIRVFEFDCIKHIAQLYDWKGPKMYKALFCRNEKQRKKYIKPSEISNLVNATEKDAVTNSTHEFLLKLLTSRKFGICFESFSYFRQNANVIQGKIIGFLQKPWCNPKKTELIIEILKECPDLLREKVRRYVYLVNPLRVQKTEYVEAVEFLTKIINTFNSKFMNYALKNMTLTDLTYIVQDVCFPLKALVAITGSKILRSANFNIRISVVVLLLEMFKKFAKFMSLFENMQNKKSNEISLRGFQFNILNHIAVNFPPMDYILYSLHLSIDNQDNENVDVLKHLEITLDLVLLAYKYNRPFVNKTSTILNYLHLLRPLYTSEDNASIENHNQTNLELKAVKTILLLYPKALNPNEEVFSSILKSFMKGFINGSKEVHQEASALLHRIFKSTGIFDSCEMEITIWLHVLRFFDTETIEIVVEVFLKLLQVTTVKVDYPEPMKLLKNCEDTNSLFKQIESGLSVRSHVENMSISKFLGLIVKGVEIVYPFNEYLEFVCLLLYHYYDSPEYVLKIYEMHFTEQTNYMKSWLPNNKNSIELTINDNISKRFPQLKELQMSILIGDGNILNVNEDDNIALIMIYVQLVTFTVSQLVEKQKLNLKQAERSAMFLIKCIEVTEKYENTQIEILDINDSTSYLETLIAYVFNARLNQINTSILVKPTESNLSYLFYLKQLSIGCKNVKCFSKFARNFDLKIINAISISLQSLEETKQKSSKLVDFIKLIESFEMSSENCLEILKLLCNELKYSDLITETMEKSIYYYLFTCVLRRITTSKVELICDDLIIKISKFYMNIIKEYSNNLNFEDLEETLYEIFFSFHQIILKLDINIFELIFIERKISKATIKLACLLLERDSRLHIAFLKNLPNNYHKKEIIYPLLEIVFRKELTIDANLLQKIYQEYKNGFLKTIEKPQKSGLIYKENVNCSIKLISECMPKSECIDFSNKSFKFDVIELYQIRIIHAIYRKAISSVEIDSIKQRSNIFLNFINVMLQMISALMKKQSIELEKMEMFAFVLYDWLKPELNNENILKLDISKILNSQQWINYCKMSLKTGMFVNESNMEYEANDEINGIVLQLLAFLCNSFYEDYVHTKSESFETKENLLFELFTMVFNHSKFYDIVFNQTPTKTKTEILHVLYVLAKKNPFALTKDQIPILLGSYQAKLIDADRYVLALLNLYELNEVGLHKYRPFIWGESAIAFYALRSIDDNSNNLFEQETSISQVMALINPKDCEYTINNFPIWRKLDPTDQLPTIEFCDPELKYCNFGTNSLERDIESRRLNFEEINLRICQKREGFYDNCYDPAFLVPLMTMCFEPGAYSHPVRPVQNGLLSIVFAALSSQHKCMRLAAGCAQLRYKSHFEENKFYEKNLWIQIYLNIQAGLNALRESFIRYKKINGIPRSPLISSIFIAKTCNITTDPTNPLYKSLTSFLRLQNVFDFQSVPNFNSLFYSPDVEHHEFRKFIIEVIRSSLMSSSDMFLLLFTKTFKVLMGFYGTIQSTLELKLLLLSIFSRCSKIPASSQLLIEQVGILPWLNSVITTTEFHQFDVIEGVISILNNLWYSVEAFKVVNENIRTKLISQDIYSLVLLVMPILSGRISISSYSKLMNILWKTTPSNQLSMSRVQLENVIECARKHFDELVTDIENILKFGDAGAITNQEFCKYLYKQKMNHQNILALSCLRSYVIAWIKDNSLTSSFDE